MSFVAWSTPFLKTDQNEPVSPCVTTAILMRPALLAAIRGPEAVDETGVAVSRRRRARLDRAERGALVEADGDAVGAAEDLEPYVVAERIPARAGEDPERAAAQPQHGDGGVDVSVPLEPVQLPDGTVGVDLRDLLPRDVANCV